MSQELFIYNSLSGEKEKFEPINPPFVGLYVCGPTVYNEVHIGNIRTFVSFDLIYRYLLFLGYKVRYVRNITDVGHLVGDEDSGDDKIATRARLEQLEPMEIVQKYTNYFHEMMKRFNTLSPSIEPTATGHILEQIELTQRIIDKGLAYESNGSVYFDVKKYALNENYGELSGRKIDELIENTRNLDGQDDKRSSLDFALWKNADPSHLMKWNSPWGKGFPGWHLECTVMSTKYLGETFDIHGGGMDLKFPHHECEIAQAKAGNGKKPVKYWLHTNMLTMNGKKMSKSEGTFITAIQLMTGEHPSLTKGYSTNVLRFFMMQAHYRSTLDFSDTAFLAAETGLNRLLKAMDKLPLLKTSTQSSFDVTEFESRCYKAMNDDFNSPVLIAHLFEVVKFVNSVEAGTAQISDSDKERLQTILKGFVFDVLGLLPEEAATSKTDDALPKLIELLITIRNDAKKAKDYATSDKIRNDLAALGVQIMDTKEGTTWEKI